jgi:hypothetical protein
MKSKIFAGLVWGLFLLVVSASAAPMPERKISRPESASITAIVEGFLQTVRSEDWDKAEKYFFSDFWKSHKKMLLDGSLLKANAGQGKSAASILAYPKPIIGESVVRGNYAWVELLTGNDPSAQQGILYLELGRENGDWKLLRFPPSPWARDAARADRDGKAAGRWLLAMLQDGTLSAEERGQIRLILPSYYALAMQVYWEPKNIKNANKMSRRSPPTRLTEATITAIDSAIRPDWPAKAGNQKVIDGAVFVGNPAEEVQVKAKNLADQALQKIYQDLIQAKGQFSELALFDQQHVKLTNEQLTFGPTTWTKSVPAPKMTAPRINIYTRSPQLVTSQVLDYPRIVFLRQKIEISCSVLVKDKALRDFIEQTIEKRTEKLQNYERQLGGEPLRNPYS